MKHFTISLLVLVLSCCSAFAQEKKPFWNKGYAGDVELGFLIKSYPYATLSTTHGYCFLGKVGSSDLVGPLNLAFMPGI